MQIMEQETWKNELEFELHRILEFWQTKMLDKEYGGFIGALDFYGNSIPKAAKGSVLNARILWTFSAAFLKNGDKDYRNTANQAYVYFKNNFRDKEFGGIYWKLNENGSVNQSRKQIYAQAFAIYGLAEYYKVSENKEVLTWCIELFEAIEKYAKDAVLGGYIEAFTREWEPLADVRLSEKDSNEKKTMNTHLHILEAYTNLYSICQDRRIADSLRELIVLFIEKFINNSGHLNLFFNEQWELQSDKISYGHDIEAAWLLLEAAEVLSDKFLLNKVRATTIKMADVFMNEGLDKNGGIKNEYSSAKRETDGIREWWCQAEAMVGLNNSYELTGNKKYLETAHKVWLYIQHSFIDENMGEWHWRVDEAGVADTKLERAGFWKCPYHNTRACMLLM